MSTELLSKIELANKKILAHNQEVNKARAKKEALEEQVKKDLLAYNKKYGTKIEFNIDSIKSEVERVMGRLQAQYDVVMKHLDSTPSRVGGTGSGNIGEKSASVFGEESVGVSFVVPENKTKSAVESTSEGSLVIRDKSKPAFLEEDDDEDDWFFNSSEDEDTDDTEGSVGDSEDEDAEDADDFVGGMEDGMSAGIQSMFQSLAKPRNTLNVGGKK